MEEFRPQVELELRSILLPKGSPLLGLDTILAYHMGFSDQYGNEQDSAKGKYLRSLFCLAMCAGLGGKIEQVLPAAASLELAHRTSLIFDDIQDNGRERNNQPTVWAVWGVNQAINAGFALSSYAHIALHRLRQRGVPSTVTLEVWRELETAILLLCQGQFMDVSFVDKYELTVDDYLEMVRGKTGALFATACEIGAMIAGVQQASWAVPGIVVHDQAEVDGDINTNAELAYSFGMNMGIAFQIHDDYLGIWGEEEEVGKTANDLMERKRSLPVILALEMLPGYPKTDQYTIRRFLKQRQIRPQDAAIFKEWMEDNGVPGRVKEIELEYSGAALEKLDALGLSPEWRGQIAGVLRFVTNRKI